MTLSIWRHPAGGGSYIVDPDIAERQPQGWSTATVTAIPANGYEVNRFEIWYDYEQPTIITGTTTVEIENDGGEYNVLEIHIYFVPIVPTTYTVTVVADPAAGGNVTGGGTYSGGSTCTINATPNTDYRFLRWTFSDGQSPVKTTPYSFTVNSDVTCTAHFRLKTYLPLCTAQGVILCDSQGRILYDG